MGNMMDAQGLANRPEDDLLVGNETLGTHRMDGHAIDQSASGALCAFDFRFLTYI